MGEFVVVDSPSGDSRLTDVQPTTDTPREAGPSGSGPLHGSIAFSQDDDGAYAWGIAWSFDSSAGAQSEALGQCREYGGTRCAEAGWFQEACGALAIGDGNGYGTGWGATTAAAERDALSQCRVSNHDCRIEVARCAQSEEAGGKGRDQATHDACWYAFAVMNNPDPDGSLPDWYFWADDGPKATREELDASYCATVDNQFYSCRIETCCMTPAERDSMPRSEWHGCPSGEGHEPDTSKPSDASEQVCKMWQATAMLFFSYDPGSGPFSRAAENPRVAEELAMRYCEENAWAIREETEGRETAHCGEVEVKCVD